MEAIYLLGLLLLFGSAALGWKAAPIWHPVALAGIVSVSVFVVRISDRMSVHTTLIDMVWALLMALLIYGVVRVVRKLMDSVLHKA